MSRIKRKDDGWEYAEGVKFSAEVFHDKDMVCAACHRTDTAIRLRYPETLYFDFHNLETHERGMFLCPRCVNKLLKALNNPIDRNEPG